MKIPSQVVTLFAVALLAIYFSQSAIRIASAADSSTTQPTTAPVIFHGGFETDGRDRGRPVILIAAALNVPTDVFRQAFTGVKPAGPGQQPQDDQVRRNKQALLKVLGPYGVDDETLNKVSNYYRYSRSRGEMWRNKPAMATAIIINGVVTGINVTDGGSGYSSPPSITVAGYDNINAVANLIFTTDFKTNGSIKSITLKKP